MEDDLFAKKRPQTEVKHDILESYLRPWAKIVGTHFRRAYYVDAFAGTGKYESGEEGSPVIGARILLEERRPSCQFEVICIEKKKEHVEKLRRCQSEFEGKIPFQIVKGEFTNLIHGV